MLKSRPDRYGAVAVSIASPRPHTLQPRPQGKIQTAQSRRQTLKVTIIPIMRRLLVLANALLRDGRNWIPGPPQTRPPSAPPIS